MRVLIICVVVLLSVTNDIVCANYQRLNHGWLSKHRVMATWDEAYDQCQREGAVLASPISPELYNGMKSNIISKNSSFFTGIRATISKLSFQSIEGVLLDDMPVSDMFEQLNPDEGQCLAMSSVGLQVVPCTKRLPYMCYKKKANTTIVAEECGSNGYKYVNLTNSCYKFHSNHSSWMDAFAICASEGGYLAINTDPNEPSVLAKDILLGQIFYTWVGFLKYNATENWKSIHEPPFNSLNQYLDKNNFDLNGQITCGLVNPADGALVSYKVVGCSNKRPFLCEKDPSIEKEMLEIYNITSTKIRI